MFARRIPVTHPANIPFSSMETLVKQLVETSDPREQVKAALFYASDDEIMNEAILTALLGLWLPGAESMDEEQPAAASEKTPADPNTSSGATGGLASLVDLEKAWTSDAATRAPTLLRRIEKRFTNVPEQDHQLCEDAALLILLKRRFKGMDIVKAMDLVATNGL